MFTAAVIFVGLGLGYCFAAWRALDWVFLIRGDDN